MAKWVVTYNEYLWFKEHQPEYLTTVRLKVYDKDGNESIIQAYALDQMLERGFTLSPEGPTEIIPEPIKPLIPELPTPREMVRSSRVTTR